MKRFGVFFLTAAILFAPFVFAVDAGPTRITVNPSGTGAGNTGEVRFKELAANGQNHVSLKSPDALSVDVSFTLPNSSGTTSQILSSNAGVMSFQTLGGDATLSGGTLTIGANAITTSKITDANVTLAKLESRARPTENFLINGGMEIFQRGPTNYNATATVANLEGLYVGVDRWFWINNAGGVGTPSYTHKRVDCSAEGSQYGLEVGHSGGTNSRYMCLSQIVEARDTIPLRGRTVRFQARIKQASSTAIWKAVLINWTGTADTSIAKNLVNNWSSTTYTEGNFFTTNASYDIAAVGSDTTVGTSFTDVSVSGSISSSANNLYVALFCITANHTNATLTKCGLYDGSDAREWLPRPTSTDMELCKRFCRSFGNQNIYERIGVCMNYSTTGGYAILPLVPEMRVIPTMTPAPDMTKFCVITDSIIGLVASTGLTINTIGSSTQTLTFVYTVASGLVSGDAANLGKNNNSTVLLVLDSEL